MAMFASFVAIVALGMTVAGTDLGLGFVLMFFGLLACAGFVIKMAKGIDE